jgi:hypothetical protein
MLNKLFGSKARVKILKLFLSHPEEKFYIRQVTRELGLQLNSVRRELENLETFGLLTSRIADGVEKKEEITREDFIKAAKPKKKGREKKKEEQPLGKLEKKYYQVNKNFILYEEIKSLVLKAQILYERDFIEKLFRVGAPKLLILTGFFINEPNVPVDLFIVGRFQKRRIYRLIKELENELGREVNYTLMSTREFKYRRDITDIFLYSILEGKKIIAIDEFGVE